MADANGWSLVEYLALNIIFGLSHWVCASQGDLIAVEDLNQDSFSVVVLVLLVSWYWNDQGDRDRHLFFWFQGALEDLGREEPIFVENELEECVAVSWVEEIDSFSGLHLEGRWAELEFESRFIYVDFNRHAFGSHCHFEFVVVVDDVLDGSLEVSEGVFAESYLKTRLSAW